MDCARVDDELVAFHLAALDGATRAAVETHLVGCGRCVGAYLALKRAVDAGDEAPAPSQMTRARVRAEAQRALAKASAPTANAAAATRPRRATWAIAATAAAAMIAAPFVYVGLQHEAQPTLAPSTNVVPATYKLPPNGETVDTARATPENLAFL